MHLSKIPGFASAAFRALAVAGAAFAAANAAEDYTAWAHSRLLYYDTSPSGAGVPGAVTGFPVLVRLSAPEFPFSEALRTGRDLRFSKPDGTPMPFEIDSYDSTAGKAAIWVLADTVKGGSKGALLRLYWGNPAAAASGDSDKVFTSANGFLAAWHLGGRYQNPRPNSVPGGKEAVAGNYDADEQTAGMIGLADSLDGGNPGDHLQTWQPLDSISKGFTFSMWARPVGAAPWQRLMDFGNGAAQNNLLLGRVGSSDSLYFENWNGTGRSAISAAGAILPGEWQLFAVTVAGKSARIYRNGVEVAAGDFTDSIASGQRLSNYIGRSNWSADAYFRGVIDEPEVSFAARSADWIKLAYANQKPGQALLSFTAPILCTPRFAVPGDTTVNEGTELSLAGVADCADQFEWSVVQGPSIRLLDAEVKELVLFVPRLAADSSLVLRFTARYGDSVQGKNVRISIKNTIPEPEFSLPEDTLWSGRDSLLLRPKWANLAALQDSGMPALNLAWTLSGVMVDTLWRPEGILLLPSPDQGALELSLCADNGGPSRCQSTTVSLGTTTRLITGKPTAIRGHGPSGYGADGRYRAADRAFGKLYDKPIRPRP